MALRMKRRPRCNLDRWNPRVSGKATGHAWLRWLSFSCVVVRCLGQGTINITFDGPPAIPSGAAYTVTNYSESGMSFRPLPSSYGFTRTGPGYPGDPQNGTAFVSTAFTQSLMFSSSNGSLFGVNAVDLA